MRLPDGSVIHLSMGLATELKETCQFMMLFLAKYFKRPHTFLLLLFKLLFGYFSINWRVVYDGFWFWRF